MSHAPTTYADVLSTANAAFEALIAEARRSVAETGGIYLSTRDINACLTRAVTETVSSITDVAILSALIARPDLLHAPPAASGPLPTAREAIDTAVAASLRKDLQPERNALVGEGQDAETLPAAAIRALAALSDVEASGGRMRDAADIRRILEEGDWLTPWVYHAGVRLAEFLSANGHAGVGNDLHAAVEARHAIAERESAPAFR